MEEEKIERLVRLLEKLKQNDWERFGSVTKRGLLQLLPGGPLFDAWIYGLKDRAELEEVLALIIASLQEITEEQASGEELMRVHSNFITYLDTFERLFLRHLDSSNYVHTQILKLLKELAPPPRATTPTVFLISGPSASGKDALLSEAHKCLGSRGFFCEFLKKYTTRGWRSTDAIEKSGVNYYEYPTEKDFEKQLSEGEIILAYTKYGNEYGFSKRQLEENARKTIPTLGIISDFDNMQEVMSNLRKNGLRVVSILVYAPEEDCRRRMRLRNLAEEDVNKRIDEMERDCRFIEANEEQMRETYNFRVDNSDDTKFNQASSKLYKLIEASLRSDAQRGLQ